MGTFAFGAPNANDPPPNVDVFAVGAGALKLKLKPGWDDATGGDVTVCDENGVFPNPEFVVPPNAGAADCPNAGAADGAPNTGFDWAGLLGVAPKLGVGALN